MIITILLALILVLLILVFLLSYKAHGKVFGNRFEKDPLVTYYSPEDFNILREEISINSDKKITLRGYVYNKEKKTKDPVVIFSHGMWSNVDAYNQDICYFAKAGYEVIALNHQGVSSSDGASILAYGSTTKTLDALLNYLKGLDEYQNRDIYLVGHSWGGYGALSVLKFHPEVKKVIAISPIVSPKRVQSNFFPGVPGLAAFFINLTERFKVFKYANLDGCKVLKKYQGKLMVVASKDDPIVNFENNAQALMKAYPNYEYIIKENRAHNPNYTDNAILALGKFVSVSNSLEGKALDNYKKSCDFKKMGELDSKVMDKLVKFLDE